MDPRAIESGATERSTMDSGTTDPGAMDPGAMDPGALNPRGEIPDVMDPGATPGDGIGRRDAIAILLAAGAALAIGGDDLPALQVAGRKNPKVGCIIRYQIDPSQRDGFREHARRLIDAVPRSGARLAGFFLPCAGTNDVAWALIVVDSVAGYERYRALLRADPEARADAELMRAKRIILREERNFAELVEGTFDVPSKG
jgi:hypothetical protein